MNIIADLPSFAIGAVVGLIIGLLGMFVVNRVRGGAADPGALKKEYSEYREKVESHFEETGEKFRSLSQQYQSLYQHLAVGANELCGEDSATRLLEKNKMAGEDAVEKVDELANADSELQVKD